VLIQEPVTPQALVLAAHSGTSDLVWNLVECEEVKKILQSFEVLQCGSPHKNTHTKKYLCFEETKKEK
jgi:hypothetical protein